MMRPFTINIKVPEAGDVLRTDTRVQVSRTPRAIRLVRFKFRPLLANTDIVVVGDGRIMASTDTDVDEAQGIIVWPGTEWTEWFDVPEGADMADWWVDARRANEGVSLFGFLKD